MRFLQLSKLGLIDNLQIYNWYCPTWSLLCLFRAPHTHRSAYSLCASRHTRVLVKLLVEYSSTLRRIKVTTVNSLSHFTTVYKTTVFLFPIPVSQISNRKTTYFLFSLFNGQIGNCKTRYTATVVNLLFHLWQWNRKTTVFLFRIFSFAYRKYVNDRFPIFCSTSYK